MLKRIGILVCILYGVILQSHAHRLDLSFYSEGNELVIVAQTSDNEKTADGDVEILSQNGDVLASGKTDANGMYRWKPETMQAVTIEVYAGLGHRQSVEINEENMKALFSNASLPENPKSSTQDSNKEIQSGTMKPSTPVMSTQNQFGKPAQIILGLTFLMAMYSAWISYRNAKRITMIEERINHVQSRN